MTTEPTLAAYLRRLKLAERRHILYCLNLAIERRALDNKYAQFHAGMLPMLPIRDVIHVLALATVRSQNGEKLRATLIGKLKTWAAIDGGSVERFKMALDDSKVAKRFGKNLKIGVPLKGHTKRTTAGLKWSLPKKAYVPDEDTTVLHHFTMRKLKGPYWEVAVNHRFKTEVENYLIDRCQ